MVEVAFRVAVDRTYNEKTAQKYMKIEDIKTENKERDFQIITDWLDGEDPVSIGEKNGIDRSRVYAIISANKSVINVDQNYKKLKRIARLERIALKTDDKLSSSKDILNVIEALRKEIEGDKPLVENHTHYEVKWKDNRDSVSTPSVSDRDTRLQSEI